MGGGGVLSFHIPQINPTPVFRVRNVRQKVEIFIKMSGLKVER